MGITFTTQDIEKELIKTAGDYMQNGNADNAKDFLSGHHIGAVGQMHNHDSGNDFGYLKQQKEKKNENISKH